jgi:tRNA(Ile)-lysidine synthase
MTELPLEAARESGLVRAGAPLLVMVSGGGDSVALLDVAVRLGAQVSALHVNYGLRDDAPQDQALVQQLCSELNVSLTVEQVRLSTEGNLQERARDARYALAEALAQGDYAAAHTASDQAETVLYRLAVSPGSRALHGMSPRRGRLVRPLLGVTRDEVRAYLRARGLDWREDPSNADRRFARARVRHDVLDALRELSPAAERTITETARQLRDEAEVLDAAVSEALNEIGGGPAISLASLLEQPPAVRRLVLRALAERAAGAPGRELRGDEPGEHEPGARSRPLSRREADEILALGERGTKSLDLGGGLRAVVEYGTLRFTRASEAVTPEPVLLSVPGRARFGDWEVEARLGAPGDVTVSDLASELTVRAWREGDRMRPAGLGGSKSLQDLFTDRKVPRALRRTLPVIESDGEIVWVAGVAVGEHFAAAEGAPGAVGLSARSVTGGAGG